MPSVTGEPWKAPARWHQAGRWRGGWKGGTWLMAHVCKYNAYVMMIFLFFLMIFHDFLVHAAMSVLCLDSIFLQVCVRPYSFTTLCRSVGITQQNFEELWLRALHHKSRSGGWFWKIDAHNQKLSSNIGPTLLGGVFLWWFLIQLWCVSFAVSTITLRMWQFCGRSYQPWARQAAGVSYSFERCLNALEVDLVFFFVKLDPIKAIPSEHQKKPVEDI